MRNSMENSMATTLRKYIKDTYSSTRQIYTQHTHKLPFIQIDDQDEQDNISYFCNIFITFKKSNTFELELSGPFPITREIADLAEIYNGKTDGTNHKVSLVLNPKQIEVLLDLTLLLKKTAEMGEMVGNPFWHKISARTISSLKRFVRIVQEYVSLKQAQLI